MLNTDTASASLFYSTVRIVCTASDGSKNLGTAFFFEFRDSPGMCLPLVITNKHVVEGSDFSDFLVHLDIQSDDPRIDQGNAPSGNSIPVRVATQGSWMFHPTADLCALPIATLLDAAEKDSQRIFYRPLYDSHLPSESDSKYISAIESVLMVGYPTGIWDSRNNLPIVRQGITASPPNVDYQGEPIGIVDIACYPGSSGSPIVILHDGAYFMGKAMCIPSAPHIRLLGILSSGPRYEANGNVSIVNSPTAFVPIAKISIPIHLGFYIKSSQLRYFRTQAEKVLPARPAER
jgi:Trypsin-like peptidase domain